MNLQLQGMLEALLKMIVVLNEEMIRLSCTDQFTDHPRCLQLIEHIRSGCMECLQNLRTIEHRVQARGLMPPKEEE